MTEIVANIGHNWYTEEDSEARLLALIRGIATTGAQAVALPMFKADEVYREEADIDRATIYNMPRELLTLGVNEARKQGMKVYITPYYPKAIEVAERLNVHGYHVHDGELRHDEMMEAIGKTGKPVLIAAGLYLFDEIKASLSAFFNPDNVTLLHSTGGRPTFPENAKLPVVLEIPSFFWDMGIIKYGIQSTFSTIGLDTVAMGYKLDVLLRTIDLEDLEGIEGEWSITSEGLREIVNVSQIVGDAVNPDLVTGFLTAEDIEARNLFLRDGTDFLKPCNCGENAGL